jgi:RNA polymerase sigma factor (sigma-70 family)
MHDVEQLFQAHHQQLYRYLVRLGGDADRAADAAQDAFVRAFEQPPPGGVSRAWLYTVATNALFEQVRTMNRRERLLERSPDRVPIGDAPPQPDEYVEREERRATALRLLDTLGAKERTALLMREEGFSHREIAVAVGTTAGSVGTLLARALQRLATHLSAFPELA